MLDATLVAFAATTDADLACEFYEEVLGLRLVHRDDFACAFDAHGTTLRVTKVAAVATPGYTVLGWQVVDIVATMRDLADRGVDFLRYDGMDQDEHGRWTSPSGHHIAWFPDPDGNVLSLTQPPD